ncbi:hypothetical protein HanPSC8_Chr03g0119781 [Helianthus annuus]|nr:hypothetical protein HanPSC8_Chr03g0119781 [Helianthus annuus]
MEACKIWKIIITLRKKYIMLFRRLMAEGSFHKRLPCRNWNICLLINTTPINSAESLHKRHCRYFLCSTVILRHVACIPACVDDRCDLENQHAQYCICASYGYDVDKQDVLCRLCLSFKRMGNKLHIGPGDDHVYVGRVYGAACVATPDPCPETGAASQSDGIGIY